MERLTEKEIANIYWYIANGLSKRNTAFWTNHTRRTIAKYIEPQVIAGQYNELRLEYIENDKEKAMWKMIAIISLIGYSITFITVFINTSL